VSRVPPDQPRDQSQAGGTGELPLPVLDEAQDAATRSLADALRVSFRILKVIMLIVAAAYLGSGFFMLDQRERALVLQFGRPIQERGPGGFWLAAPSPIHEVVREPVDQDRSLVISSQWFKVSKADEGKSLDEISGKNYLEPGVDGALMTGDEGLVHVKWTVVYRVGHLRDYLTNVGAENEKSVVTAATENAAIHVAAHHTAEEMTQKAIERVRNEVKQLAQDQLDQLHAGIRIQRIDIEATPPLQVRTAFKKVTEAESEKQSALGEAQQKRTEILLAVAGPAYKVLLDLMARRDVAMAAGNEALVADLDKQIERVLLDPTQTTGEVRQIIQTARANAQRFVTRIKADKKEYEKLLGQYLENREILISRLWEQTKREIFASPGTRKIYLPEGQKEIRIQISRDPRERAKEEERLYKKQAGQKD